MVDLSYSIVLFNNDLELVSELINNSIDVTLNSYKFEIYLINNLDVS